MIGLLIKDLCNTKKMILWYLATVIICFVLSVLLKNISYLYAMGIVSEISIIMTTFAYEERDSWPKFVAASGLNPKIIVLEKYVIGVGVGIIANLFSIVAFALIKTQENSWAELVILILFQIIVISCCLPAIYKFGVEKSRIFLIAIILIAVCFMIGIAEFVFKKINITSGAIISIISLFVILLSIIVSYFISLKIYNKKEF